MLTGRLHLAQSPGIPIGDSAMAILQKFETRTVIPFNLRHAELCEYCNLWTTLFRTFSATQPGEINLSRPTGANVICTTLIGFALVSVQILVLGRVTEQPALRTFFGVSLLLNWVLNSRQWASSFAYSNAFRGVKAPWGTIPAHIHTAPIPRGVVANTFGCLH